MFQLFAGRVQQTKLNRRGGRQRRRQEAQWQPGRGRQHTQPGVQYMYFCLIWQKAQLTILLALQNYEIFQ